MLVSTNTHFLEEDYMIKNKPRSKVTLDELRAETNEGNEVLVLKTQVSPPTVVRTQDLGEPHRSGWVVRQPGCFIGLGEVLEDPKTEL